MIINAYSKNVNAPENVEIHTRKELKDFIEQYLGKEYNVHQLTDNSTPFDMFNNSEREFIIYAPKSSKDFYFPKCAIIKANACLKTLK